jgi:hypothetical protein
VQSPNTRTLIVVAIVGYTLLIAAVFIGMFAWRRDVLADMATPEAQSEWNDWRTKAAQQDGKHGPVQLTVSKSPQPPVLVLMRDFFPACVIGLLVPLSALYGVIAWLVCGVLRQSGRETNYLQHDQQ